MTTRPFALVCLLLFAHSLLLAQTPQESPVKENSSNSAHWDPYAIFDFNTGDDFRQGSVGFMVPLAGDEDSLLFLSPEFGFTSNVDPSFSLGLGARQYISAWDIVIGGNIFYDRFESLSGNDFNQFGFGVEVLTDRYDFRFNYFIPESTPQVANSFRTNTQVATNETTFGDPYGEAFTIKQQVTQTNQIQNIAQVYQQLEKASEGLDMEVGVLVPYLDQFTEVRLFAGYYNYQGNYGNDLAGGRARAEWHISPRLALEAAYFEDSEITGDNWTFGFRVNVPIQDGPNALQGTVGSLFRRETTRPTTAGSALPFSYWTHAALPVGSNARDARGRMMEQVLRPNRIQTDISNPFEVVAERETTFLRNDVTSEIVTINDSVVFVDNVNGAAAGTGAFEDPTNTIQNGVNAAGMRFADNGDVIVAGNGTKYVEEVLDAGNSVRIWGSEKGIAAQGGKKFAFGTQPVFEGSFAISDVPAFSLSGFTIEEGANPLITIDDVGSTTIICNTFNTTGTAIDFDFDDGGTHSILISDNTFTAGLDTAIDIDSDDSNLTGTIESNQFQGGDSGIFQDIRGGKTNLTVSKNTFTNFTNEAIMVEINDRADIGSGYDIFGNSFTGNGTGIYVEIEDHDDGNIDFRMNARDNVFTDNDVAAEHNFGNDADSDDLYLVTSTFDLVGNTFISSNTNDIWQHGDSDSDADDGDMIVNSKIENNTFSNTQGAESILIEVSDWDDEDLTLNIDVLGNNFMNLSGDGLNVDVADIDLDSDVVHTNLMVKDNNFDGVGGDAITVVVSDEADLTATIAKNTIRNVAGNAIFIENNSDPSSATVGGNTIETVAGTGITLNSLDIGSGIFGNNIVTGAGTVFDINDSDGQVLINGVLAP